MDIRTRLNIWLRICIFELDKKKRDYLMDIYKNQYEIKPYYTRRKERVDFDSYDSANQFFPTYKKFLSKRISKIKMLNKRGGLIDVYCRICVKNIVLDTNDLALTNWSNKSIIVILNNRKSQLFASFLKNFNLIRMFSTGYVLQFLDAYKKGLRRKLNSFTLLLKTIFSTIERVFLKNFFIFQIRGTKKNFYRWLNFLKIRLEKLQVAFYLYTPSIKTDIQGIKKIKSIKRRLKKKYMYSEGLI